MKLILLLTCILFVAACSVESDDSGSDGVGKKSNKFMDERETIKGPKWEGKWISDCNPMYFSEDYRIWQIEVKGETIQRVEEVYSDSECKMPTEKNELKGIHRFVEDYEDGTYEVEYAFKIGNGITSYPLEKILVDDTQLYISDFVIGSLGQVNMEEPLYLNGEIPESSDE